MSHGDLQFRWDASRDGRRRRVLMDEHGGDAAVPARRVSLPSSSEGGKSSARTGPAQRYAADALAEHQARITDLVPKRVWTLLVLLLLALTGVAGIAALYSQWGWRSGAVGREAMASLNVSAPGSLASWFSSLLLLAAAVGSVLIYTIRRHKADDYRGRYRVWLWAAAVLLVASMDATARLHVLTHHVVAQLTGAAFLANTAVWPLVGMALVYGLFGVRMFFEVRSSRGATASLAFAVGFYLAAAAVSILWPERPSGHTTAIAFASLAMLGHVCVWYTVVVYARNVYLDAQGALPVARRERKTSRKAAEEASGDAIDSAASRSADNSHSRSSSVTPSPVEREKIKTVQADSSASEDEKPAKRSWFARLLGHRNSTDEASEKKPRKQRPTKTERLALREAKRAAKRAAKQKSSGNSSKGRASAPKVSTESTAGSRRITPGATPARATSKPQDVPDDAPRGGFARIWRKQDDANEPAASRKSAVAKSAVQDGDDDDGDESAVGPDGRKLSKSERRRMRKLQRRAARHAA